MAILLFSAGTLSLGLAVPVRGVVRALETVGLAVAVAWAAVRLTDVLSEAIREALLRRGDTARCRRCRPLGKTAKILLVMLLVMAVLANSSDST